MTEPTGDQEIDQVVDRDVVKLRHQIERYKELFKAQSEALHNWRVEYDKLKAKLREVETKRYWRGEIDDVLYGLGEIGEKMAELNTKVEEIKTGLKRLKEAKMDE